MKIKEKILSTFLLESEQNVPRLLSNHYFFESDNDFAFSLLSKLKSIYKYLSKSYSIHLFIELFAPCEISLILNKPLFVCTKGLIY